MGTDDVTRTGVHPAREDCYTPTAFMRVVHADIRRQGFSIVRVASTPPVCYTVGLTEHDHPELWATARTSAGMDRVQTDLAHMARAVVRGGIDLRLGPGEALLLQMPHLGAPYRLEWMDGTAGLRAAGRAYGAECVSALHATPQST